MSNKPAIFFGKSHVDSYTRGDGVVVQAHETSVTAAAPKTVSQNEGWGYHGEAYNSHRREVHGPDGDHKTAAQYSAGKAAAASAFSRVAHQLVTDSHFSRHEHARDFLDSTYGRHLGDAIGHKGDPATASWLPKAAKEYKQREGIRDEPAKPAPKSAEEAPDILFRW